MNDLYLELAQSQVGRSIFQAFNLPKPPQLFRSPERSLNVPRGQVLIAGLKNNFALKSIVTALSHDSIKLCTLKPKKDLAALYSSHARAVPNQAIEQLSFTENSNHRIKSYVFDATGLKHPDELKALYSFFSRTIKSLKKNGHIIVIATHPSSGDGVNEAALSGALEGFVKSLAKEVGKKGANCNLIRVGKGTERQLQSSLYYFLSDKSAYVTGQSLNLVRGRALPRKINWEQPLKGKYALVTGAAQGIGAETARVLARDGACVVCLDIPANEATLKKIADSIGGHALTQDLGAPDACDILVSTLASQLGVIDIVVHNAGITRDKTLAKMPPHFWEQVLDINLGKIMQINASLFEKKVLSDRARIVCISSISGIAGNFGQTNYATSKAGVAAYVEKISTLLADGRTINAIAPGFIETDMTKNIPPVTRQIGRRSNSFAQGGEPLDVAEAVSLFCHPASQALNGNVLRVCGQSILGK
jgi:3-oxoacyl-[acyl-carrier protein] reductase